ncbi:hypothetical protein ILYODFUR_002976, partial [Ilyodon furcidens]
SRATIVPCWILPLPSLQYDALFPLCHKLTGYIGGDPTKPRSKHIRLSSKSVGARRGCGHGHSRVWGRREGVNMM